jgi:hypothetical protein
MSAMSHSGQWSAKSGAHYLAGAVEVICHILIDLCLRLRNISAANDLAHVKDASRVTAAGGASAVPADGGSSLPFPGGSGISLPAL